MKAKKTIGAAAIIGVVSGVGGYLAYDTEKEALEECVKHSLTTKKVGGDWVCVDSDGRIYLKTEKLPQKQNQSFWGKEASQ